MCRKSRSIRAWRRSGRATSSSTDSRPTRREATPSLTVTTKFSRSGIAKSSSRTKRELQRRIRRRLRPSPAGLRKDRSRHNDAHIAGHTFTTISSRFQNTFYKSNQNWHWNKLKLYDRIFRIYLHVEASSDVWSNNFFVWWNLFDVRRCTKRNSTYSVERFTTRLKQSIE